MITEKDIKPIPKAMLGKIKKLDRQHNPAKSNRRRFYKYFTRFNRELCEVTVAVRDYKNKWYCKQVVVHELHGEKMFGQDIGYTYCGGYCVGWFREGIDKIESWKDYDWGWMEDNHFNIEAPFVNKEFVLRMPQFKYSAVDLYNRDNVLEYLRLYEQYPATEYLVKCGLAVLATSKIILKKCAKDKKFCKWLYNHRFEIGVNNFYTTSIVRAYNENRSIEEAYQFDTFVKSFQHGHWDRVKKIFKDKEEQYKFLKYLEKQKTDGFCYWDYLEACEYLHLDMNLERNRYPHDFKRWHDIRIDEYRSKKAEADAKQNKMFCKKFAKVAKKYGALQQEKNGFAIIIAKSPADLKREGEMLHHCVGSMNYDQKFAREETLIFFVRNKDQIETPFVTLEYSLKNHKVLQCYGEHDTTPEENVLQFVNNVWLPYANRKLKKVCA